MRDRPVSRGGCVILGLIGLAMVLIAAASLGPWKTREKRSDDLKAWIRDNEVALTSYANKIRSDAVGREKGMVTYPPPEIPGAHRNRVIHVTKDDNSNVYFVTDDSFVTFNVGFVLKAGDLLGDKCEPRIVFRERAFGDWWIYRSN